jgi:hypothetical protein
VANHQIRTDMFPAVVNLIDPETGESSIHDKCRVILTLDAMYVFQDAGSSTPTRIFEDRLVSYTPPTPATRVRKAYELLDRSAHFETADGYTGTFMRASGCGCGSRLKTSTLATLFPDELAAASSTKDS